MVVGRSSSRIHAVGLVAKFVPGDPHNYMGDLHSSPHQRLMIAEINQAYSPALVLLDGVEAFVEGGPESGRKVRRGVILAVCSKNDLANALEPFDRHPDMVLRRDDIACFVRCQHRRAEMIGGHVGP